jgi:hypothetical protein
MKIKFILSALIFLASCTATVVIDKTSFPGVSGVNSENSSTAPETELPGANTHQMSKFDFTIEMDGAGKFLSVRFDNIIYQIEDWNSQFIVLNPKSEFTQTTIISATSQFTTIK